MISNTSKKNENLRTSIFQREQDFVFVIEPTSSSIDIVNWCISNRPLIEEKLLQHGAVFFKGFGSSPEDFKRISDGLYERDCPYLAGLTRRRAFGKNMRLASEFPRQFCLQQHGEMSYMRVWPMRVLFYCETPAESGGETSICSIRQFMKRVRKETVDKFLKLGIKYERIYPKDGRSHLNGWRDSFFSDSREDVERICKELSIGFEWLPDGGLRNTWFHQAVKAHPVSGELVWHNHISQWGRLSDVPGALTPALRAIKPMYEEKIFQELMKNGDLVKSASVYYGDGSTIELEVLEEITSILEGEKLSFPWNKGDFIILENMLTFHGRNPYEGENRRILAALKEPSHSLPQNILRLVGG